MVLQHAIPGACSNMVDYQSLQKGFCRGVAWALAPCRMYARAWASVMAASDDGLSPIDITWMPAHTAEHDVGHLAKSNGELLSAIDRASNGKADLLAKAAAGVNRAPRGVRERIEAEAAELSHMAVWLARVTQEANHFPLDGRFIRDSTAVSARLRKGGIKRKVISPSGSESTSAAKSLCQVERMLKVPRLSALRDRILSRRV